MGPAAYKEGPEGLSGQSDVRGHMWEDPELTFVLCRLSEFFIFVSSEGLV